MPLTSCELADHFLSHYRSLPVHSLVTSCELTIFISCPLLALTFCPVTDYSLLIRQFTLHLQCHLEFLIALPRWFPSALEDMLSNKSKHLKPATMMQFLQGVIFGCVHAGKKDLAAKLVQVCNLVLFPCVPHTCKPRPTAWKAFCMDRLLLGAGDDKSVGSPVVTTEDLLWLFCQSLFWQEYEVQLDNSEFIKLSGSSAARGEVPQYCESNNNI